MTALLAYCGRRPVRVLARVALLFAVAAATPAHAIDTITVVLDQAKITKLPEGVATIVIGNPLIADITVQPGGLMVVTGKGFGSTNLIALDRAGAVLSERNIEVLPAQDTVAVFRGGARTSYSCTPQCEPRITLGDAPEFFDATVAQSANRAARAAGAAK